MKFLIQRVTDARVEICGKTVGQIEGGLLVLIGVCETDTRKTASYFLKKMIGLRIFEDENGKTNKALADVYGQLLLVSQFTLYADCRRGNRPGFQNSGSAAHAEEIYDYIVEECRKIVPVVETGRFGADMKVSLTNDGPFTILLDDSILPQNLQ